MRNRIIWWFLALLTFLMACFAMIICIRNALFSLRIADRVKSIEGSINEPPAPARATVIPVEPSDPPVSRDQHTSEINVAALGPKFDGNFDSNIGKP